MDFGPAGAGDVDLGRLADELVAGEVAGAGDVDLLHGRDPGRLDIARAGDPDPAGPERLVRQADVPAPSTVIAS